MVGDQFDRRWLILGGFAVVAAVIVAIILISRGGGDSGSSTTASKEKGAHGCTKVAQPKPREESLPKPKMTTKKGEKVTAVVETNCGTFEIELATGEAPTIANSFAYLAEEGFYDELTFHRIVPEFVIQGGDPTGTGSGGPGYEVVEAPPKNLKYTLGTVAMAKTSTAPSGAAGSQFYVVSGPQGETLPPEYALAGHVTKGLDVVKRIGELGGPDEKPTEPVVIEKMSIERG
ncbi:MAG TPA: peptidylprolyl isomerase [Solirubrobacterales bacterium]|nr:peptidylprolyl isomerase [Solirubrobacterales bacterium]